MNLFTAFLASEHLQDLLREAEDERRRQLVRSVRPTNGSGSAGLWRRLAASLRRRWPAIARPGEATTDDHRIDGGAWLGDIDLLTGHRA